MSALLATLDTDAIVVRDAFRAMIETLSDSEKSIHRATRLAFTCAKNGIANEVIELIIQKMEKGPNMSRRLELLFLLDSIMQLSHKQKGETNKTDNFVDTTGACFVPIIEAQLHRLLLAAARFCVGAPENHRKTVKVLQLWSERKILSPSCLQSYVNNIDLCMKNSYPADRDVNDLQPNFQTSSSLGQYFPPSPPDSPPPTPPLRSSPKPSLQPMFPPSPSHVPYPPLPPSLPPPPPLLLSDYPVQTSQRTHPNLTYPPIGHGIHAQQSHTLRPKLLIPPPSKPGPSSQFSFLNTVTEKPPSHGMVFHPALISEPWPSLERQRANYAAFQALCVSQRPLIHSDGFQPAAACQPLIPASSEGQPMMGYGQPPTSQYGSWRPV